MTMVITFEDEESSLPMWKGMSFPAWSEEMEILLKEKGKWDVIAKGKEKTRKSITDDYIVFDWLSTSLDEEDWAWLSAKTAKEIWERVHSRFGMNQEDDDDDDDEVVKKTVHHKEEECAVTSSQIGRGLPCKEDELSFAKPTMEKRTHDDDQCQSEDQEMNLRSQEKAEEIDISHRDKDLPERGKTDAQEEVLSSNEGMLLTCICNEELVREKEELKEKEEKMLEWQEACDLSLKMYEEEECKGMDVSFEENSEDGEIPSCVYEKTSSVSDLCMKKMKSDDHQETMESFSFEEARNEGKEKIDDMEEGDPPLRGAVMMFPTEVGSEESLEEVSFHCHGDMANVEEERGKRKEGKEKRKNEREEKEKRKMKKRWPMSHKHVLSNICLMSTGLMKFNPQKRNEKMKKKDDNEEDRHERKMMTAKKRKIWQVKGMMREPPWRVLFRSCGEGMKKNTVCIYPELSADMVKRKVSSGLARSARRFEKNENGDMTFEEKIVKRQTSHIDVKVRSPKKKNNVVAARIKMKKKKIRRMEKKRRSWSTRLYPCSKKKEKKKKMKKLMKELKDEEDIEDDELDKFAARKKMRGLLGRVKMKARIKGEYCWKLILA